MRHLLPDRRELARAIGRLYALRYPNYPTDHIMTKTTYLDDPEGQNIELYADTPEDGIFGFDNGNFIARRANGASSDGREPLDVEALFRELMPDDQLDQPMPSGTKLGHVHLYVANLDATHKSGRRFQEPQIRLTGRGTYNHQSRSFQIARCRQLRDEREKRIMDAIQLRIPDRVPINCPMGYFPAKYAGIP